jgi:NAD(P)-dependent dehydrogenase (short-subunit alcohol dehydrogenase family)
VALPEEMPVNETVEFERALRRELDMAIDQIVVNAVHPVRFRQPEVDRLRKATGETPVTQAALNAALSEHTRARAEHGQVRRLRRAASAPVATLPRVFEPELSRDDLDRLSLALEHRL